ncbi:MAG: hypothetical protein HY905_15175 [Deltaproteobacteria bacterium]|nr:hypothetical protein [Deltaproteobacteria bacterium]
MNRDRSLLVPVVLAVGAAGCISMAQGVGPIPVPGGGEGIHAALAAGGGPGRGTVQAAVGAALPAADWFAADVTILVNGVYQSGNDGLRAKQDLTVNWGLWPLLSGIFYMGPVDLRISVFGIGGGGPEGPGGYMGHASGTLGLRIDEVHALWAGFSAQAVFGCCNGEYDGVSYQVPVGLVFERVVLGGGWDLAFALEALWSRETIDGRAADGISLLLHVLTDWVES